MPVRYDFYGPREVIVIFLSDYSTKFSFFSFVRFTEVIFYYGTIKSVRLNQVSALECPL